MEETQEETKDVSLKDVALKYGVINALLGIIFFVLVDFAGLVGNQVLGYLPILITAVVMYFAHKEFVRDGDGFMNYGQGLGLGTLMSLISAVLSSIFSFVYVKYVNTNYISNLLDIQRKGMEEQGMSEAQVDQAMSFTEKMMSPVGLLIIGILAGVFFGFIVSLIVSAITKKSRPEFE